jgi:hypothetical protein
MEVARTLTRPQNGPGFEEFLGGERARSREYGGATAFQPPTAIAP